MLLAAYQPRTMLVTDEHQVTRARFPAIDAHNHLGRWITTDHDWACHDVAGTLAVMDTCGIQTVVNLDGMWGDELEANLDRYDRAFPNRFVTFAQAQWRLVRCQDFGRRMARQLEDSVVRGARGLKIWKTLGLRYHDAAGRLITIDDPRLSDLWETAGALGLPVLIHSADPVAFFRPRNRYNERWEELRANPNWYFYGGGRPTFEALIEQFERLIACHPKTTFIGAHVGCYAENLGWVERMLRTYPNFHVDISARLAELGRQPYTARGLFERFGGRILFGLDSYPPTQAAYAPYFRFLETRDEYFPYSSHQTGQRGRWNIYGIGLDDDLLRRIYHDNAARLLELPLLQWTDANDCSASSTR